MLYQYIKYFMTDAGIKENFSPDDDTSDLVYVTYY